jgi:hypothetical protein
MKGMLDFLQKAGLVTTDALTEPDSPAETAATEASTVPVVVPPVVVATGGKGGELNLADIYANTGVATSVYPAERLLRLVDGLSAMDQATRNLAIKAMDAADESWTIDDPLTDAAAKVRALTAHGEQIRLSLQQFERETQGRLDTSRTRQEKVLGEIRKQMAELDALLSRETVRGAQEIAAQEANLTAARERAERELGEIAQVSMQLQSLATQFGSLSTIAKG